jgi:hypothetical protein
MHQKHKLPIKIKVVNTLIIEKYKIVSRDIFKDFNLKL